MIRLVPSRMQAQAAGSGTDSPLQQRAASPLANGRGPIPRASPGRLAGLVSLTGFGVVGNALPEVLHRQAISGFLEECRNALYALP